MHRPVPYRQAGRTTNQCRSHIDRILPAIPNPQSYPHPTICESPSYYRIFEERDRSAIPRDAMTTLIVPACGKSLRFGSGRPKWMKTHPAGEIMLVEALRGITGFDRLIVGLVREHIETHR